MIISTKICKSIIYSDFITQNVHPAKYFGKHKKAEA